MSIPDAMIQDVRERVDMIALVERNGVTLKKSGRSYKGLCPFHQEKSPSFHVWADEKRYKCFGCQAGGDAISFLQRMLGKPFVDTVQDLARDLGIDIHTLVDPGAREKTHLKEVTDFAAWRFQEHLWHPQAGHTARAYLRSRGLTQDTMRTFALGWAPLEWTDLTDKLQERGLLTAGEKVGLVAQKTRGEGYYDVFRGRLMIPIRSPEGRTIAFAGRTLEEGAGPKYLNSRESRLYSKSDALYGTDLAREAIRRKKSAVLVEGYFDCIVLHQAGIRNSLAMCSTALTSGHLQLLSRIEAKELILLLDGDEAGRTAVKRLATPLLNAAMNCRVAALPADEDPDSFARAAGAETVQRLLREAPPLTQYLFHTELPKGAAATFEDKMAALECLKPVLTSLPTGLVRSAFLSAMARHFGLRTQELEASVPKKPAVSSNNPPKSLEYFETPPDQLEASWGALLLRHKQLLHRDEYHVLDELNHMGLRLLIAKIRQGSPPEHALYDAAEPLKQALERATSLLPEESSAAEKAFVSVSRRLKLRSIEERLQRIAHETSKMPGASSELTQDTRELLEERGQLLELKRQLLSRI